MRAGRARWTVAAGALLLVLGCRRAWTPPVDLGTPAPPEIPWLASGDPPVAPPALTPCPTGWHETTDEDGIPFCDAYGPSGPDTCADDEAHFPGEPGCRRIGPTCDAVDPFPQDLPTGRVIVYVLAGEPARGDGSRDHPFGSLTAAIQAAPEGAVVAVGRGEYDEAPIVTRSMDIVGACVAETLIAPTQPPGRALVIRGAGVEVSVSSLGFTGDGGAVEVIAGAHATVDDVAVLGAAGSAIWVESPGSRCVVSDLVVRPPPDPRPLSGLTVATGATLEARRVVLDGVADGAALFVSGAGARATIEDLAVSGAAGATVGATDGGSVTCTRAWLSGGTCLSAGAGASMTATDVVVVGPAQVDAVNVFDASAEIARLRAEGTAGIGVWGVDSVVRISDMLVRDGPADLVPVVVARGAEATLSRSAVLRVSGGAVWVGNSGSSLTLSDLRVSDVVETDDTFGNGLTVRDGAALVLDRGLIERCVWTGIWCQSIGARVDVSDVLVRDVTTTESGTRLGAGLEGSSCRAHVERFVVERVGGAGIRTAGGVLQASDVVVRDVGPEVCTDPDWCHGGAGIAATGGEVDVHRFRIERVARAGLAATSTRNSLFADGMIGSAPSGLLSYDLTLRTERIELLDVPDVSSPGFVSGY